ncbi:hypothetical protein HYS01_02775 [Candidatus Saccharibacteria bacterium]|nr:hypothetical protein [Candidatus Saccharibacteria bacterium]
MIHAALWLISACIVVTFVLVGLGLAGALLGFLFSKEMAPITIGAILLIGFWVYRTVDSQNKQTEVRRKNNTVLQQQCIDRVRSIAKANFKPDLTYLKKLNVAKEQAITDCEIKYPTY